MKNILKRFIWSGVVAALIFVVSVFSLKAYVVSNKPKILAGIKNQLGFQTLELESLEIVWRLYRPKIHLHNVNIEVEGLSTRVSDIDLEIRIKESLRKRDLRIRSLEISGLNIDQKVQDQLTHKADQGKDSLIDVINRFRQGRLNIEKIILSDSKITLQKENVERVVSISDFKLDFSQRTASILGLIQTNSTGKLQLNLDLIESPEGEWRAVGAVKVEDFPVPLAYLDPKDQEYFTHNKPEGFCKDYFETPCLKLEKGESRLKFQIAKNKQIYVFEDLKIENSTLKTRGQISVDVSDSSVEFDVDLKESQGSLETILYFLPMSWLGKGAYVWLLNNLEEAKASQGLVAIKGRTGVPKFEKFLIELQANSKEVVLGGKWPSLKDVKSSVLIKENSLLVKVHEGQFGRVKIQAAQFEIPSFSEKEVTGNVKIEQSINILDAFQTLKTSAISKTLETIDSQIRFVKESLFKSKINLAINFSQFDKKGLHLDLSFKHDKSMHPMAVNINAFHSSLNEVLLDVFIQGQVSQSKNDIKVTGKFEGLNSSFDPSDDSRWDFGKKLFGQFKMDLAKPLLGIKFLLVNNMEQNKFLEGFDLVTDIPSFKGNIKMDTSSRKYPLITANIERLWIPMKKKSLDSADPVMEDHKSSVDPRSFPSVKLNINSLNIGKNHIGKTTLEAYRFEKGFERGTMTLKGENIDFGVTNASWLALAKDSNQTSATGFLKSKDSGKLLKSLGIYEGLQGGESVEDFKFSWKKNPWDFSLKDADGFIKLNLEGGELAKMDSVVMKLIDIVTLKNLKFYEKGSKINFANGTIHFKNNRMALSPLLVEFPSAKTVIKGDINLQDETLALDAGMELNIANTLGVAAAGILFGPVGVVASYFSIDNLKLPVLSKLNKLSAFSYRLDGPWAKPKISNFRSELLDIGRSTAE